MNDTCFDSSATAAPAPLAILYRDAHLVAVSKPAGLLVHRSMIDKRETRFAMQMVRDQIGQHVYTVHRLDRPTSGVLIFALSKEVARALGEQFAQQQIRKRYLALVRGHTEEGGVIDYPLKEQLDAIADKHARQDKPAQAAVSHYQRLARFELPHAVGRYPSARYSLLALSPKTGRKHQLRRHMSHIRHPIVGDVNHGDNKHNRFVRESYDFNGLALQSVATQLPHPVTGDTLSLVAPLDRRIVRLLTAWGWQAQQFTQLRSSTEQWLG